jgi:hypothetical protein
MATITCACNIVNGARVDSSTYVPGITNISVNPSTTRGIATGTITITAHGFNSSTGVYLEKIAEFCRFLRISGEISWINKLACGVGSSGSTILIPGNGLDGTSSGPRLFFYPQILSPVVIETGDGEEPGFTGSEYSLTLGDILNTADDFSPSYSLDASGGPQSLFQKGFRRSYKDILFEGLHPLFTFNTLNGAVDKPSVIEVITPTGTDVFEGYVQSFSLNVEPPRPATITFTFIYEDTNLDIEEIDNCE